MAKQSIFAYLGLNTDEFQKGMGRAKTQMNGFEKAGASFAKNMVGIMGAAFAADALITFGKESLALFDIQEKAQAKVAQAVSQTGGAAKKTADELFTMASGLQEITIFGDEAILNDVTAQLLTFTNIAGDQFDKAQVAALDLATVLGTDLKSVSIQLGKALNDPVKGINALTRSGVSFTQSQKDVIKSLVASGDIAKAQTLILDELNRQYGGQAEAAAASGAGRLQQLANSWGDIKEVIGKELMNGINAVLDSFSDLWDVLSDLMTPIGELFGAFDSLNGEFSIGAMLGDLLTMSIKAMSMMLKPMVWIVQGVADGFKYLYENSEFFRQAIDVIRGSINAVVKVFNNLGSIMLAVSNSFGHLWEAITEMDFDGLGSKISGEFKKAFETKPIEEQAKAIQTTIDKTKELTKEELKALEEKKKAAFEKKKEGLNLDSLKDNKLNVPLQKASKSISGMLKGLDEEFAKMKPSTVNIPITPKLEVTDTSQIKEPLGKLVLDLTESLKNVGMLAATTFGAALGTAFAGGDLSAIGADFLAGVSSIIEGIGQQMISLGIAALLAKESLKALFANPALAIAAGIGLVAIAGSMKSLMSQSAAPFANGGLVTGSVFANIGEGIGTNSANPEVIAPLDKLKNFINPNGGGGMGGGDVQFRIEGNTLVGILDRQQKTSKYSR